MWHRLLAWCAVASLIVVGCATAATPTSPAKPAATSTSGATAPTQAAPRPTPTLVPKPSATAAASPAAVADKYGGVFRYPLARDDEPWDVMTQARGAGDSRIKASFVFNQLLTVPNTPKTGCSLVRQLDAAKSWQWKDDRTLDVTIYQGIRFQDKPPANGRELTAEDVVFSVGRLKALQPRLFTISTHIVGIEATDKYNVRLSLDQPFPSLPDEFLATSHSALLLAKESGDFSKNQQWGSWSDPTKSYIGTGPFQLGSWSPGVKTTYQKHPNYWKQGLPYLDGVEVIIMPDRSTQLAALGAGKIDALSWAVPLENYLTVKKAMPQMTVSEGCVAWGQPAMFMNTQKAPFNDVRVRRAVSTAVDRDGLRRLLEGQAAQSVWFPPSFPFMLTTAEGFPADVRPYLKYDPAGAKKLLTEAGYPQGFTVTLHAPPSGYPRVFRVYSEAVLPYLEAVGIKTTLKVYSTAEWDAVANEAKYEGLAMISGTTFEPWQFMSIFHSQNGPAINRSLVRDPQMDALVEELNRTVDQAKREELAKKIQVRMVDQAYWVNLPTPLDWAISQPWVRDYGPIAFAPFASTWAEIAWIDKSKKR